MREKLIEKPERSLVNDGKGREMRFVGGDVTPVIANGVTLDNQVSSSKWISVKDRLPGEDGYYLCCVRSFSFRGSFYPAMLKYDKGGFIEGHIYTDDVTHWMPLPEPPKGE